MKIDMTTVLLALDGKPIPIGPGEDSLNSTLRTIVENALLSPLRGDENVTGAKKAEMFILAMRAHTEDQCDMKAEEITMVKERIGRAFPPLIVGRAYEILDPTEAKEA